MHHTVSGVMLEALVMEGAVVRMVVSSPSPRRQVGGSGCSGGGCRGRRVVMVMVGRIGAETTRSCRFCISNHPTDNLQDRKNKKELFKIWNTK